MSESASPERGFPLFPAGLAALGFLAVVVGRGYAQALPGTVAGFDQWVSASLTFGAFCTQFFAVVGATLAVRCALWLGLQKNLGSHHVVARASKAPRTIVTWIAKGALAASALFVCGVVFVAAQPRVIEFGPVALTGLSLSTALLLGFSASLMMEAPHTRAVSLVATHAALAALIHTLARLAAFQASADGSSGQFEFARGVTTAASAIEWVLLVLAGLWLWRNSGPLTRAFTAVLVICSPALVWGEPTSGLRLATIRAVEQLCPHPDPFLPTAVRLGLELVTLALACGTIVNRKTQRLEGVIICFALLGRSSGDTPLGALLLLLTSLALLTLTAVEPLPANNHKNDELSDQSQPRPLNV